MAEPKELSKELQMMSIGNTSLALPQTHQNNDISVFGGEKTTKVWIESSSKIRAAFPNLGLDFHKLLEKFVNEENIPDSRLKESVDNVIKNCIYPTPTIAQFLSYDRRIKLFNYNEAAKQSQDSQVAMDILFICLKNFQGRTAPVWVNKSDFELIKHLINEKA